MIKVILHAFVENGEVGVVELLYASTDEQALQSKYQELIRTYPADYLAIYDLPLDTDLNILPHYPSVAIGKEEFGEV